MSAHRRQLRSSEEGAVAIVAALLLSTLVLLAAFVLDLGALRADRTASQSMADLAATAGVVDFDPVVAGQAQNACETAVSFASTNLMMSASEPLTTDVSCADAFPSAAVCPSGPFNGPAVFTRGPFTIEIVYPVQDGDPLMGDQALVEAIDGVACERLGVRITRDRELIFGPITGAFGADPATDATTNRGAVARSWLTGRDGDYASLVVLRREGCGTLRNAGGGKIRIYDLVRDEIDPDTGDPVTKRYPGIITVDTTPSGCSGGQRVIDANTSTGALVEATGRIVAHSLVSADSGNAWTFPPSAVPTHLRGGPPPGRAPEAGPIITRAPVDHIYNCQKSGYVAGENWSPVRTPDPQPIAPCPDEGSDLAYIELLRDALDPITAANAPANGFAVWPTGSQTCADITADLSPSDYAGNTKIFFDCDAGSGPDQFGPTDLRLNGFTHVIFRRGITVGTSQHLEITGPTGTGTVVYIKERGVRQNGGRLLLQDVFTYIDAPTDDTSGQDSEEFVSTGSTDRFALKALLDNATTTAACEAYASGAPPAACFAPLALWSNSRNQNELTGGGNGGVIGSIFTPRATFRVRGSADDTESPCTATVAWGDILSNTGGSINLESAQFFASAIDVAGGGTVRMCPNPDTAVPIPLRGSGLIR